MRAPGDEKPPNIVSTPAPPPMPFRKAGGASFITPASAYRSHRWWDNEIWIRLVDGEKQTGPNDRRRIRRRRMGEGSPWTVPCPGGLHKGLRPTCSPGQ